VRRKIFFSSLAALLPIGLLTSGHAGGSSGDLAIIVNKAAPVSALSGDDLRVIYLGRRETWSDGSKVIAIVPALETPEAQMLLKTVCHMAPGDYKKYFMQMAFQGKSFAMVKTAPSAAVVKALVSQTPGAIGVVRVSQVDTSVNVVKLDGVTPGEPGYKLSVGQ
jgi:ABC-type phosphate transport system substrate-binding protein